MRRAAAALAMPILLASGCGLFLPLDDVALSIGVSEDAGDAQVAGKDGAVTVDGMAKVDAGPDEDGSSALDGSADSSDAFADDAEASMSGSGNCMTGTECDSGSCSEFHKCVLSCNGTVNEVCLNSSPCCAGLACDSQTNGHCQTCIPSGQGGCSGAGITCCAKLGCNGATCM